MSVKAPGLYPHGLGTALGMHFCTISGSCDHTVCCGMQGPGGLVYTWKGRQVPTGGGRASPTAVWAGEWQTCSSLFPHVSETGQTKLLPLFSKTTLESWCIQTAIKGKADAAHMLFTLANCLATERFKAWQQMVFWEYAVPLWSLLLQCPVAGG